MQLVIVAQHEHLCNTLKPRAVPAKVFQEKQPMSCTSSPQGGHGERTRRIYPFVIVSLLAILLVVGALAFYPKSQAAPASRLDHLPRNQMPTNTPTNTSWYFDGGSIGGGFQEYLTMQNADPSTASNVTITYFLDANPPTNPTH